MKTILNIIWFIMGGFMWALSWLLVGLLLCVTVVGIPFGIQCFKAARLIAFPFGTHVTYGGGIGEGLANIIWLIFFGWWLALMHVLGGIVYCCTIIGIPFGLQMFKFAKLSLMPFGATVA